MRRSVESLLLARHCHEDNRGRELVMGHHAGDLEHGGRAGGGVVRAWRGARRVEGIRRPGVVVSAHDQRPARRVRPRKRRDNIRDLDRLGDPGRRRRLFEGVQLDLEDAPRVL